MAPSVAGVKRFRRRVGRLVPHRAWSRRLRRPVSLAGGAGGGVLRCLPRYCPAVLGPPTLPGRAASRTGTRHENRDRPVGTVPVLVLSCSRAVCPAVSCRGCRGRSAPARASLDGDLGAGALEGGLSLVRSGLVDLLQDGLRGAVDQVLGLLQAEAGEGAHLLDDLDLLVAGGLEDDVELVLLLDGLGGRRTGGATSGGDGDGGGGGDLERLLELLHEVGELDQGHLLERLEELVGAELRHGGVSFLCRRPASSRAERLWGGRARPWVVRSGGQPSVCSCAGSACAGPCSPCSSS